MPPGIFGEVGGHEFVGKGTDHATPPCDDWLPEDWLAGWAREAQVLRHHLLESGDERPLVKPGKDNFQAVESLSN